MSWKELRVIFIAALVVASVIFLMGLPWKILGAEAPPQFKDRIIFVAVAWVSYGLWLLTGILIPKVRKKK